MPERHRPTRHQPTRHEPDKHTPGTAKAAPTFPKVHTRSIDMGTLANVYNRGLVSDPSYTFSNGRKFIQTKDKEIS